MTKGLINKLRRGIKRVVKPVVAGAFALGFTGFLACSADIQTPPTPNPIQNSGPVASLYANPTSGVAPLDVNISLEDVSGNNNIVGYRLGIDKDDNNKIDDYEEIASSSLPIIDYNEVFDITGTQKILGEIRNSYGETDTKSIEINVSDPYQPIEPEPEPQPEPEPEPDYVKISGNLEDETDGRQGIFKVYDTETQNSDGSYSYSDPLIIKEIGGYEYPVNSSGEFSFTLEKLVDPDDKIYVISRTSDSDWENGTSYIDITDLSARDHSGVLISPTSFYSDFDGDGHEDIDKNKDGIVDLEDKLYFVEHEGRENFWSDSEKITAGINGFLNLNPYHGLKKWNHGELPDTIEHPTFKGFKIDKTSFPDLEKREQIKTIIRTTNCPGASEIPILEEADPIAGEGWAPIYHSDLLASHYPSLPYGACALLWDANGTDGYLDYAKVYINNTDSPYVVRHEAMYHVYLACPGHSNNTGVPKYFDSIGEYSGGPDDFTGVNIKFYYIIEKQPGMKPLKKTLGLDEYIYCD